MKFPILFKPKRSKQFQRAIETAKENYNKLSEKDKIFTHFCPYCGAPLIETNRTEPLETLDEHVTCSYVCNKTVYKCSAKCEDSRYTMWNYDGESYLDIDRNLSEQEWNKAYEKRSEINKRILGNFCGEALGSYWCSQGDFEKEPKYKIRLFRNQKVIPVIEKTYHYNEFAEPKYFTLSLKYYIKDGSHCIVKNSYTYRIKSLIWRTKRHYHLWKENPTERNLKKLYGIFRVFKTVDDRKGLEKFYYKYIIPFIFGTIMGIKYKPSD